MKSRKSLHACSEVCMQANGIKPISPSAAVYFHVLTFFKSAEVRMPLAVIYTKDERQHKDNDT